MLAVGAASPGRAWLGVEGLLQEGGEGSACARLAGPAPPVHSSSLTLETTLALL